MDHTEAVKKKYAAILHLSRPDSEESRQKHPRMSLGDRAKIFSPFAALRGHDESLRAEDEKRALVTPTLLTEGEAEKLSDAIMQVKKGMVISATYFKLEEPAAQLGRYLTVEGTVTRLDPVYRVLVIDETAIPFDRIFQVFGEEIQSIEDYLEIDPAFLDERQDF